MVEGFEKPDGDPDAIRTAVGTVRTVATDLATQEGKVRSGSAEALETWKAPRAETFRSASAGIQVQVRSAQSSVASSVTILTAYAQALAHAQDEIARLRGLANTRQDDTETDAASMDASAAATARQQAAHYIAGLRSQADDLRTHLRTLARQSASALDAATDTALPGGSRLSPAEVRRQVDHAYGVEGTQAALAGGRLDEDGAWAALVTPSRAVKSEDVKEDGEPDWPEILREANDQAVTGWAIGSAPTAGWALGQLARNYSAFRTAMSKLPQSFVDVMGPDLDAGRIYRSVDDILGDVERSVQWTSSDSKAAGAGYNLWRSLEGAGEGGLPKGFWAGAGHAFSVLGAAGDVMTLIDPGVDNETEGNVLRGAAGLNLAGIGAVEFGGTAAGLLGLDAAVGWVPVVGQVVVIGTGLFLAGDWVYHHWDTVKGWGKDVGSFVTDTVPHALSSAEHGVEHGLSSAGHGIAHGVSSAAHFLGL